MNELALMNDVLQRQKTKTAITLSRVELGSLAALLRRVEFNETLDEYEVQMLNEQSGRLIIRIMQKLMNAKEKYSMTLTATERYAVSRLLTLIDFDRIGMFENNLIMRILMEMN